MDRLLLRDNITKLLESIRLTAEKYDRPADAVTLVAVSKTRPANELREAFECGLREFGESYLQEALEKIETLADLPLTWHFIGPIQSNKTRPIAVHFDWVHSVEREKIARRLDEQRPPELPPLQVCLQVNISGEASKSGADPDALPALAAAVMQLPRLQLRGLMAIPARSADPAQQRAAFARLRALFEDLRGTHPELDTLSMGMSGDYRAAIAEGATVLRVGTGIFGPRDG
ncbi:YggS family pyridoxal phosphate-dependent enzyme [Mangrovimicrobium sediminis]|uniref:Pyridoxal phosphate homeostasis protein n=1 Tax=Mangrovimicrobium sediminis TaxID=2562682 RepID=A0A4Z0LZA8_9GAMM|nr:YggS family pyridoxal phosphate-dependent enzyme [Haliea sp. SAOS-164]TGD72722.1 YggS family pyridoxal phosphate-dependent enzyme [Haliea sp. SAOS-164]